MVVFCTVLTSPKEQSYEESGKLFGKWQAANQQFFLFQKSFRSQGAFNNKKKLDLWICCSSFSLLLFLFLEGTHLKIFANLNHSCITYRSCHYPKLVTLEAKQTQPHNIYLVS